MPVFDTLRLTHADISIPDEHVRVDIAVDCGVCAQNSLEFSVDKEIVRVDVLFDETFDLEKCW